MGESKPVTGPQMIDQHKPHPTQGTLSRTSAQKDVPYKSAKDTPKKGM